MSLSETKSRPRKIVVNRCYGGFGLSEAGIMLYAKLKGLTVYPEKNAGGFSFFTTYWLVPPEERLPDIPQDQWQTMTQEQRIEYRAKEKAQEIYDRDIARDDPALAEVVETLGDAANGMCAELGVTEIPADVDWQIEEYDGREWVSEAHRTW